jgi:hypothetical protein
MFVILLQLKRLALKKPTKIPPKTIPFPIYLLFFVLKGKIGRSITRLKAFSLVMWLLARVQIVEP